MDTTSLQSIVRTIFTILVVYYLLKFLMRLLAPYLLQQMAKEGGGTFEKKKI